MCPDDLIVLVSAITLAIAKDKSSSELSLLAAIFVQIGDSLATYSEQQALLEECCKCEK